MADPTFAPVLNIPALSAFLVVLAIFSFLQWRVAAIGRAVNDRTHALEELRQLKARELSGESTHEQVEQAVNAYREAYQRVEDLRTVIPGIARIVPPPPSTSRMQDNDAAAQQFLGISPTTEDEGEQKNGLSPALVALLAFVAASQIMLLGLLVMDPMSADNVMDTVGSVIDSME